jgi:hypothetical protein
MPFCPAFVPQTVFAIPKNAALTFVAFQLSVVKLGFIVLDDLWRRQRRPFRKCLTDRLASPLAELISARHDNRGFLLGFDAV